jgi:GxxExxY protein
VHIEDIVADDTVILELKSVSKLNEVIDAQLINCLKLTKLRGGYLLNFHGITVERKRFVEPVSG